LTNPFESYCVECVKMIQSGLDERSCVQDEEDLEYNKS
jgi:hypothetical protein